MPDQSIARQHHATFEGIRQLDANGDEYWSARDIAPLLEYQDWRIILQVVDKARIACDQSGRAAADHFGDTTKMVPIGSGALRPVPDVHLSRYACYLIVQNGENPRPHGQHRTRGQPVPRHADRIREEETGEEKMENP